MVCAFVSGLSGEEIIVFVLPFKDDAWDTSTIFHHVRARACSLIMRMRRGNKKGRMRFRARRRFVTEGRKQQQQK